MRVTISYRYCFAFELMLLFSSLFFLSRSEAGTLFIEGT